MWHLSNKTLIALIVVAILVPGIVWLVGSLPKSTPTKWDIVMTSPTGMKESYTVESYLKPRLRYHWGGQTTVYDPGTTLSKDWEQVIVAPSSWRLEVKPHLEEKANDSK